MHSSHTSSVEESAKVKRCTRISFECHTDLLLDDLWEGLIDDDVMDRIDEEINMDLLKRLNDIGLGNDDVLADLFR